jgi:hypothetical protein
LRVALRQIENYVPQESTSTSKPHISKAVTGQSEFDEIKGMIQQLGTRMDSFETFANNSFQSTTPVGNIFVFLLSGSIKLRQQDLFPIYTAIDAVKFSNYVVNVGI